MAWVKFDQPYFWSPARNRGLSLKYKAGFTYNVPRTCAEAAIAAGAAKRTVPPGREKPEQP